MLKNFSFCLISFLTNIFHSWREGGPGVLDVFLFMFIWVIFQTVLWKRLNTESDPKVSLGPFPSFFKNYRKSLKNWKVLRDFRIFWVGFRYIYIWFVSRFFGSVSSFFWVRFRFSKKVLYSPFFDRFPLFFGSVSSFFGSVSGFQKKF